LNEEAASHNGCKVRVGKGCIGVNWDGGKSVRVSTVGVVHGCVARVVRGINVMTQGRGLKNTSWVSVGRNVVLEFAKRGGRGKDGFSCCLGNGTEAG
jgi:hypothetical protein